MNNDLISRQAAIDAVKNLLDSMIETDTIGFYEIEYALFEVPSAQPEHKWVPVREELPREYGIYLVTTNKGNVYLWPYKPEMEKTWVRFVTAWCYLPEPYEE